jgi:hypothetical protein
MYALQRHGHIPTEHNFPQDTRSTAVTLQTVEDGILRASLRRADLL